MITQSSHTCAQKTIVWWLGDNSYVTQPECGAGLGPFFRLQRFLFFQGKFSRDPARSRLWGSRRWVLRFCMFAAQTPRFFSGWGLLGFGNQGSVGVALFDCVWVDGGGVHNADSVDRLKQKELWLWKTSFCVFSSCLQKANLLTAHVSAFLNMYNANTITNIDTINGVTNIDTINSQHQPFQNMTSINIL